MKTFNQQANPTIGDIMPKANNNFQNNADDLFGKINQDNAKFRKLEKSCQNRLLDLANSNKVIGCKTRGKDGIKKHTIKGTVVYIFKALKHQKRVLFLLKKGRLEMVAFEDGGGSNTTDFLLKQVESHLSPKKVPEIPSSITNEAKIKSTITQNIQEIIAEKIKKCEERERELTLDFVRNEARITLLQEINQQIESL